MTDLCKSINKFGKGIGNVSRYRIVEALFSGPKRVGELVKATKQSQPLVSQHLRILKETGLVKDQRQGQEVFYRLDVEHTIHLLKVLLEELKPKKIQKTHK